MKKEFIYMLEMSLIVIMNISLLSLIIILVLLFIKHLDFTHGFMEDLRKSQLLLHQEMLNLKLAGRTITIKSPDIIKKDIPAQVQPDPNVQDLKSTPVSDEELSKLIEGKNLVFKNQVSTNPGDMFINTDIDI